MIDEKSFKGSELARQYISKNSCEKKSFSELIPNAPSQVIELLEKMLVWDPEKRISVEDVLNHPFFAESFSTTTTTTTCEEHEPSPKTKQQELSLEEIGMELERNRMVFEKKLKCFLGRKGALEDTQVQNIKQMMYEEILEHEHEKLIENAK